MNKIYVSETGMPGQVSKDAGISLYYIDDNTGELTLRQRFVTGCVTNVSCIDRDKGIMYVTAEQPDAARQRESGDRILTLRLDKETGEIRELIGETPTLSPNPVYLALDPTRHYLVCANHALHSVAHKVTCNEKGEWSSYPVFDDSTVLLYSLNDDGTIHRIEDVAIQEGSGPLRTQTHAHPHCAVFSPSGRFFAVPDKGADKVFCYRIENGKLVSTGTPYGAQPGDEPRFCAFHPSLPVLYVNHEGNTTLDAVAYTEDGRLNWLQTVEAGPAVSDRKAGRVYEHQGIAIHPDGRALYSVIRGMDCVAVYGIDKKTGLITLKQLADLESEWPRCGEITPDGKWFAAGNRVTGDIFLFEVLPDGTLQERGRTKHPFGVHYIRT